MTVEFGPMRQVWFAPTDDPDAKQSFLVRDDAYSRMSATLGRTLRLGEPIDTGPISAAYQTTWSGGRAQRIFTDTSMFLDSNFDSTDPSGRLKFWPSIHEYAPAATGVTTNVIISGPVGTGSTTELAVYGNSNGTVTKVNDAGTVTVLFTHPGGSAVKSMALLDQSNSAAQSYIAVGFADGSTFAIHCGTGANADISAPPGDRASVNAIVMFGDHILVAMGNSLWKRDTASGWVKIRTFNSMSSITALAALGGTAYVMGDIPGGHAAVYTANDTTASFLHLFENSYAGNVITHLGSVYFVVKETARKGAAPTLRNALYVYANSTIRQLFDQSNTDEWNGASDSIGASCAWGKYIVVGYQSSPAVAKVLDSVPKTAYGVVLYNPENDSFHIGPTLYGSTEPATLTACCAALGTLMMAFKTSSARHITGVGTAGWAGYDNLSSSYPLGAADADWAHTSRLVSSIIDANLPDVDKTWLRVNVKHNLTRGVRYFGISAEGPSTGPASPTATLGTPTLKVYVRLATDDYNGTDVLIGTYTPTVGDSGGWRTTSFDINVSTIRFPQATSFQYVIELVVPSTKYIEISQNQIDSVSVEYMVTPTPKNVWRMRAVCEDGQERLNGDPNPLTTRTAQVDKLFSLWGNGQPLYMWDATASGITPTNDNISGVVMFTDISESSYRLNSNGEDVVSEVSFTAYQVA